MFRKVRRGDAFSTDTTLRSGLAWRCSSGWYGGVTTTTHQCGIFLVVAGDGVFDDVFVVAVLVFFHVDTRKELDPIQVAEAVDAACVLRGRRIILIANATRGIEDALD